LFNIGFNAPYQAQTNAHHFTADIHCIAFHNGATVRATSGKYVHAVNAALSLNNSLFCSVICLTSSQNHNCHQVQISSKFHQYFNIVSKFHAQKFTIHSQAFFHNGLVSFGGFFSLNCLIKSTASVVVNQSCCIFNNAAHSIGFNFVFPHIKSILLCFINSIDLFSSNQSCFIFSSAVCSSLNNHTALFLGATFSTIFGLFNCVCSLVLRTSSIVTPGFNGTVVCGCCVSLDTGLRVHCQSNSFGLKSTLVGATI
jgi:hypothetical protein